MREREKETERRQRVTLGRWTATTHNSEGSSGLTVALVRDALPSAACSPGDARFSHFPFVLSLEREEDPFLFLLQLPVKWDKTRRITAILISSAHDR